MNRNKEANPQPTRVTAGQQNKEDKKCFYDPLDDYHQINRFGNNQLPNYYNDSGWQRPVEKPKDDRLRNDPWNFKSLVEKVLDSEGGFFNRKNDRGGATNRGYYFENLEGYG